MNVRPMEYALFECEKYHCKLLPDACIKRQEYAKTFDIRLANTETQLSMEACLSCVQGKNIMKGRKEMEEKAEYKTNSEKGTPVFMCTECGVNPAAMHPKNGKPKNGLCGLCNGKRISAAFAKKKARKELLDAIAGPTKYENEKEEVWMEKQVEGTDGKKLIIDFTEYPALLHSLVQAAKHDFRPVEMQVLWMLKQSYGDVTTA